MCPGPRFPEIERQATIQEFCAGRNARIGEHPQRHADGVERVRIEGFAPFHKWALRRPAACTPARTAAESRAQAADSARHCGPKPPALLECGSSMGLTPAAF